MNSSKILRQTNAEMTSDEEESNGSEVQSEVDEDQEQEENESGSDNDEDEDEPVNPNADEAVDKFSRESELMDMLFGNKDQLIERLKKEEKTESNADAPKRKAVWQDSDDEEVKVEQGMKSSHVRNHVLDPERKYKNHLTNKFQKIVGEPKWAKLDREDSDSDSDNEALKRVGHILGPAQGALVRNNLDYRRRRDLNKATSNEGPTITTVEFHPNSCVALVAGTSGVASLLSVEPKTCEKLHSIGYKKFRISCGHFSRGGEEAIFGSYDNPYIHTFDLLAGQSRKTLLPRNVMTNAARFKISPDGQTMAVAGRFGEIHLLHAKTKEWRATLKQEHRVSDLSFAVDSSKLFVHSIENEVNVFDLRGQRTLHRFIDDGCIQGQTVAMSPSGKLLATGSGEGIVNIYNSEDVLKSKFPQPIKVISNLATRIDATVWNPTSEILGLASKDTAEGIKLAHFPSGSIFANFPLNSKAFGHPNVLAFSPGSRYLAVGTIENRVPLYELRHYGQF